LEEAKIRRRPPEKELSRQICLVVGGGNGVGRETVLLAAQRGAHIVVADKDLQAARTVATEAQKIGGEKLRWPRALIFVTGSQFGKR
jgi:NAD(P)-dependent dehydrogenase (short-subunit alcohol dehydrogenase family)